MRNAILLRSVLLLAIAGMFFWGGCKAKQEAESLRQSASNTRPTAPLPPMGNSFAERKAMTPAARPPVIVKAPKLSEAQTPPPIEKSPAASDATNDAASNAAITQPEPPKETYMLESRAPITLRMENDAANPLRIEPPSTPSNELESASQTAKSDVESALQAAKIKEQNNADNSLKMRSMARAIPPVPPALAPSVAPMPEASAMIPPPSIANGSGTENIPSAAMPMMTESAGAIPTAPQLSGAAPQSTDLAASAGYQTVKVFYGTDRAALSALPSKVPLYRGYLMLTLVAALLTIFFAVMAFRFLRWQSIKVMYIVSLSATVFLAALTGYAALYGHLPGDNNSNAKSVDVAFGDGRGTLTLGTCEVSIPKRHEVGELESPSLLKLEVCEDPNKHIVLLNVSPEDPDEFYSNLRNDVAKSKESSAIVFIHGFNVTFEDAARRTAQISYDLKFAGVPIFYSWPSQGKLLDYAVDETNAVWTVPHLRQFLAEVARQSGAKQIHLIAHSMGNRALTGALKELAYQSTDAGIPRFDQVLLTAPDIDADVFKNDIAPAITKAAARVTLYASSNDAALLLSKQLHGYPRAGEAGRDIVIVPGMDTVDVTSVDTSLLGHSYYGDSGSVLSDFVEVLHDAKPADKRTWLRPEFLGADKYWVFQR
jgi:esterase/lipase superfamily enzyme